MEKQARIILTILLMSFGFMSLALATKISSKIGLQSSQEDGSTVNNALSQIVVKLNEVDDRTDGQNGDNVFLKFGDLKKQITYSLDNSAKNSNACGDIQIILSGNETKPGVMLCKNGACEVSVLSRRDDEGNVVTDVHLKIIRKVEHDPKMNDIPVVDGVRGIEDTNSQSADFRSAIPANPFRPLTYLRNNIPEIQTRYRDEEPWYQNRRTFQNPQGIWRDHRPGQVANRYPDESRWSSRKVIVDDKIDPPLSKSQGT